MPITTEWYDAAHTIILQTLLDPWTLADLEQHSDLLHAMVAAQPYEVDIIIDSLRGANLPPNIMSFYKLRIDKSVPANQRSVMYVTTSAYIKTLLNVGEKTMDNATRGLRICATVGEALEVLQQRRGETILRADLGG